MTRTIARFLSITALVAALASVPPALADPTTDQDLPDGYTGVPDEIQTRIPQRTPPEEKGDKRAGGQINSSTTTLTTESSTATRFFRLMLGAARQEIWILLARH